LTWEKGSSTYGADYRVKSGLDPAGHDETNAVLYVYKVSQLGGVATTNIAKIENGESRTVGGVELSVTIPKNKTFATVEIVKD
jgi:hypothetical protein